jgi:hypothetical protein
LAILKYHIHWCKNWLSRFGRFLPWLGFYFTDCGDSRIGWGKRWHITGVTARFAKGLCPMCHSRQILADFYTTQPDRLSMICQWSSKHCTNCQHWPTDYRLSRSKIRRIWRTGFYINECLLYWTVALRRAIFKWKKCSRPLV